MATASLVANCGGGGKQTPSDSGSEGGARDGGAPLVGVSAVLVGAGRTCALTTAGDVLCWGLSGTTTSSVPMAVDGIHSATAIGVGTGHACALLGDGTARCWGLNNAGQLGNG